MENGNIT